MYGFSNVKHLKNKRYLKKTMLKKKLNPLSISKTEINLLKTNALYMVYQLIRTLLFFLLTDI